MSHAREKAQGFTKQLIGGMIGDELLVREGKEQQHHADHPDEAPAPTEPVRAPPAERRER
jgi:uncharacterized protein YjbJ (UPF0337 family)